MQNLSENLIECVLGVDSIKEDVKEMCECVYWSCQAEDRDQWWVLANMVMNLLAS
jgi:hypothetical protein